VSAAKKSFISAVVPQIRLPEAVLIFITMIWGGTFLAVHHAMQVSGPFFFVGLRFATATLALTLDVPEDTDIYLPMVSRLAQLTVVDVLATGFTLERGTAFRENLKRVKEALKASRLEKPAPELRAQQNN